MNPFQLMGILNILIGGGRVAVGSMVFLDGGASLGLVGDISWTNLVVSGVLSILFGIGNFLRWQLATVGSIFLIAISIFDSQYGSANEDWRFWALTAYAVVLAFLVLWSYVDTAKEVKGKVSSSAG